MHNDEHDDTLSLHDAATTLGITTRQLYSQLADGTLPMIQVGGRLRLHRRVVEERLRADHTTAAEEPTATPSGTPCLASDSPAVTAPSHPPTRTDASGPRAVRHFVQRQRGHRGRLRWGGCACHGR